ncbi:MAG: hypothetical protein PUC00_09220 [Clostridiales bacterium]|nr:hypothetical protein [Clostridiales bacterium]
MLYPMQTAPAIAQKPPMHYLDSAELLLRLRAQGYAWADMSRLTGLSVPQVSARLRLCEMDDALRAYLRRESVPEKTAQALLLLPDAVTRHRLARRIVRERLCIRDAVLLIGAARHKNISREAQKTHQQHVITLIRDVRPYRNAIRDIVAQMNAAGVHANLTERRQDGMQELTIVYAARRRRAERHQGM